MSEESIREQIGKLEEEISADKKKLAELKHKLPPESIKEYTFRDWKRNEVSLRDLFGDRNELLIVHNMGKRCAWCTMWADGFNGLRHHIENRAAFVVTSPDDPDVQKAFAQGRGWQFKMVSCGGTAFAKDLKFQDEKGAYWPGVSAFYKDAKGNIFRSAYSYFGPGDDYCSTWHFFDLLKNGADGWNPQFEY
ncbi:MAG: DUF899 family protein [Candidatus Zixiibacteriota bacterium]